MRDDFNKQSKSLHKQLKQRGIQEELAFYLYLNDFIHKTKHYTPRNTTENVIFKNLYEYFTKLKYGHCGQKPYALYMLLEHFGMESRVISYSDIRGWAHAFLEVKTHNQWQILDPTFNVFFNIGVEDIIQNPYCERKILSLYSNEFYTDSTQDYEDFIRTIIDENTHTTIKYNREWFMFMGFYSFVPPIFTFHINKPEQHCLYDIRQDNRYQFI
ncbi:transglutaminase domain-containing protein [Helicobacter sp. MIT 11-5569]|uniref:transglutaminase domain-containing protein n=1 Tax=Helicobacter sp. MIT 11-5569 TaxID=1548151 RepID=UPI000A596EF4|nr:transglutaminase domain-containing protein [Helicobacter sp. MIT 11-5569]TLD84503.1 transglutaminase domain-containing protein [Helicobacter sp. MIT 11-5569]